MKTAHTVVHFQHEYSYARFGKSERFLAAQLQEFSRDIAPDIDTFFILTREKGMDEFGDVIEDAMIPLSRRQCRNVFVEEEDGDTRNAEEDEFIETLREKGIGRVILSGYYWDRCVAGWAGRLKVAGFEVAVLKKLTDYSVFPMPDQYYDELEFPVIDPDEVLARPHSFPIPAIT